MSSSRRKEKGSLFARDAVRMIFARFDQSKCLKEWNLTLNLQD